MNKNKLVALVKTFCLGVVAALDEHEGKATHKDTKVDKTQAYTAKNERVNERVEILIYADKYGTHAAAAKFKISVQRVAAYKAHRTMGTYD